MRLIFFSLILFGCVTDHDYCRDQAMGDRQAYNQCREERYRDAEELTRSFSRGAARAGTIDGRDSYSEPDPNFRPAAGGLRDAIPEPRRRRRETCVTRMEYGRMYTECRED